MGMARRVKRGIDAGHKQGVVMWMDARVAEWKNGKMELLGAGIELNEAYQKLMNPVMVYMCFTWG